MTLILAVKSNDFLILAGDSRAHYPKTGYYHDSMKKIFTYNDTLLVGGFGSEMFISNLDYHLAQRFTAQKQERTLSLEDALGEFSAMAAKQWQSFTTPITNTRKPGVGYLILGFDAEGAPQIFKSFPENSFTPCMHTMSKITALGTDSIVTTYGEDLLRYAESLEDYKLAVVYLLWKTASQFSTVGTKKTKMIVWERNNQFFPIESDEIDSIICECENLDNSIWKHFYT